MANAYLNIYDEKGGTNKEPDIQSDGNACWVTLLWGSTLSISICWCWGWLTEFYKEAQCWPFMCMSSVWTRFHDSKGCRTLPPPLSLSSLSLFPFPLPKPPPPPPSTHTSHRLTLLLPPTTFWAEVDLKGIKIWISKEAGGRSWKASSRASHMAVHRKTQEEEGRGGNE